ncbi:MAG: threonylcarbamoyl-AMP synthase [Candidatus Omnitrophica bacterium]|nr:threonylcarbamoyl-AMP synthase [Candidatus Omnitrophota bacterium]
MALRTKVIKLHPQEPDIHDIRYCAKIIRQGGLVVFPTETVYGVAADFSNPQAMNRLREVKKRSEDKPFSILIAHHRLISNYTSFDKTILYKLIDVYWPGPLTVVVPAKEAGKTIGIRMPDNKIALSLVEEAQCPVAAPSANFEGNPPPSTCAEALKDLDGLVEVAIDGGKSEIGKGSTVVDLCSDHPKVLRDGVITQKDIDKLVKKKVILFVCTGNSCRSVMAEYLLKQAVKGREDVEVLSAGTGVFFHTAASLETVAVLKEQGMNASGHQSQPLTGMMIKKADLIFVMTREHRHQVLERVPEVEQRIYLLKEFVHSPEGMKEDLDIPDPIGTSHESYRQCLGVIKEAVKKIVEII